MSGKTLLAILGSPHRQGKTAAMLNCATEAARQNGWQVWQINLYEQQFAYCKGCRACIATGRCVQQDGLQEVADLLKACDTVVLAAPVYWANVPAVVKNLFDRLLGVAMEETNTFPKPRLSKAQTYVLLTACHTPAPFAWVYGQSRGAVRAMKEFFKTAGMTFGGKFVWTNASRKQELPKTLQKRIAGYWQWKEAKET